MRLRYIRDCSLVVTLAVLAAFLAGDAETGRADERKYRSVGTPVAERYDDGGVYAVYVRFNRRLPRRRDDNGTRVIAARFLLAGALTGPAPHGSGDLTRHCYGATIESSTEEAEGRGLGDWIRVAVRIRGVERPLHLRAKVIAPGGSPQRRLGC